MDCVGWGSGCGNGQIVIQFLCEREGEKEKGKKRGRKERAERKG